jgi:succinate dehydrogenase / fumarate reductase cytochrome b subunit
MSTIALNPIHRVVRFYEAPIGKKVIMALTGVILFGYVVAHLLGNLQIFAGPDQINRYAGFLHNPANAVALWAARCILLVAVAMHIIASVQLWKLKNDARPIAYVKKDDAAATYASRTMQWSGPIVLAFVIFHVLHLTVGAVVPLAPELAANEPNVRANVIAGFTNPLISGFYIVAILMLCMHLYHGLWSMFQSLGIAHPKYTPKLKAFAAIFSALIAVGNCSIPLAVMAGILR